MSWHTFWYDPKSGLLRSGWRVLAYLAMLIALFIPLTMLFFLLLPENMKLDRPPGSYYGILVSYLAAVPALIGAGVWALRVLERLPSHTLGISLTGAWARQLLLGLIAGLAIVGLMLGLLWGGRMATVLPHGAEKETLLLLGAAAAFMLLVGLTEELLFRGYLFQTLLRGIDPLLTLFLTSAAFALFHLNNDNWSLLGLTNIFLFGVLLGLLYLRSGSLWLPIGLHAAWNFGQVLLHVPVSGNEVPFPTPFTAVLIGDRLLTGGAFGLEGSVILSALLLGVVALVVYSRFGLPLESRWWEWRSFAFAPVMPRNWDITVNSRHYQWKLFGHDQAGSD